MISDAEKIYKGAIERSLPDAAVKSALSDFKVPKGRLVLISVGKAGYRMAKCASDILGEKIECGAVITKYGHAEGEIPNVKIFEASHPLPDEAGVRATEFALSVTQNLTEDDTVLFLVSGGGSALFESPFCTLEELRSVTEQLLGSGADINEINMVRKHISKVKGGRFAEHIYPAKIFAVVLSDVLTSRLDTIASGPAFADMSTSAEALAVIEKYGISTSREVLGILARETPKSVTNAQHTVSGSVGELCLYAKRIAESLGYTVKIISDSETGEAREVGKRLARLARENENSNKRLAYIIGGETVVKLKGSGLGGRNQELALSAAIDIAGMKNTVIFSVGSDGTDGPTDAAGGIVTGETYFKIKNAGMTPEAELENNNSYYALGAADALVKTGATGTNVNDIAVLLIGEN